MNVYSGGEHFNVILYGRRHALHALLGGFGGMPPRKLEVAALRLHTGTNPSLLPSFPCLLSRGTGFVIWEVEKVKSGPGPLCGIVHVCTRNTHSQWASRQYYYAHAHKRIVQMCACISINDIPDCDGHVHTYVHHENRSLIQSLTLMRSAINSLQTYGIHYTLYITMLG